MRRLFCFLAVLAAAAWTPRAYAQQAAQPPVAIVHTPLKPDKLLNIPPGQPIVLTVALANTRNLHYQLRAAVVSDGRYLDITPPEAKPDIQDRPTWNVEVSAPLAELAYQFVITSPEGTGATSVRYSVRRSCIPNVEVADIGPHPEIAGYDSLQKMYTESQNLEADIAGFERALDLIGQIQKAVNR